MIQVIVSATALGIIGLTIQQLMPQLPQRRFLLPLLFVLWAMALIIIGPIIFNTLPELTFVYIASLPITFLALPASLYLYCRALTASTPWHWQWSYLGLYWPQLLAIPLALLIYTLPTAEQQALFFADPDELHGQLLITAITFLLATLLWLVLSLFYLLRITLIIKRYRQQLKQVFAADGGKRLGWLGAVMLILVVSWGYAVLLLLAEQHIASPWLNDTGVILLALLLVWLLCSCGLRQQPGFAELAATPMTEVVAVTAEPDEPITTTDNTKYQRSALAEVQAQRIAAKLQQAVYSEQLYLDPALTLYKLAEHIGVSAQYLSQTLNQTLQQSFYDYINEARIAAAKQQLQHTDDSVLTIAMAVGFNARSSFYKAFKNSSGLTPAQYRAQQAEQRLAG